MQSTATAMLQEIGTETALYIGPAVLVASKSKPGEWHTVMNGQCSCIGFSHRLNCRHLAVAAAAEELDRKAAQPVESPMCSRCGRRPALVICGRQTSRCGRCTVEMD